MTPRRIILRGTSSRREVHISAEANSSGALKHGGTVAHGPLQDVVDARRLVDGVAPRILPGDR